MKILYIIGAFYPAQTGGPCNAISWLVKEVKKNEIQTTVVSTMCGIESGKHGIIPDKWIENEFGRVIYHRYFSLNLPFKLILTALKEIKNHDIVHLNSVFHPPMLILAFWAKLMKKKIMWDPGGELAEDALKFGRFKKTMYLKLFRKICQNYPVYHTTAPKETDEIRRHIGKQSNVFEVPNFIESIPLRNINKGNLFLFLGRLHPIKAIDNLILAVKISTLFRKENYCLLIAGDDRSTYGQYLKDLVAENNLNDIIQFVGHLEGDKKFDLLAQSKFMVLPSHSENFGNVVTESMSQMTPVIASFGTPWQILDDNNAGYYCANTPESLAIVIDEAIKLTKAEYNMMSQNAYRLLLQEYTIDNGVHKWLEAYKSQVAE
jgi:glycosyltransferase involved in cell wall biosynthesis